ncbi:MAG: anaerobic ribonucleoside-triphosphate reductase activating protein [Coriobacteriia bacterium]|nr:anaerobic ribonucleoside-triphosphate reductase activating protein [Coriobacteriia bacterium]MBS5478029.1 anaerobic ribonucleoside-triphosphate reductase activating protein [Coriobacteriia bacterium]
MNYAEIKYVDIANGPGTRTSLFVSGCRIHCKNCFNAQTWDFLFGKPFTAEVEDEILASLEPRYVHGLTVLGGEPMEPENQRALVGFLHRVRERFPRKTIWCFTGYTLDVVAFGAKHCEATDELLGLIDVLVDGPFVEEKHELGLRFRGSSNQRLIDMRATRAAWDAARAGLGADASEQDVRAALRVVEPVWWVDDPVYATHTM